MGSRVSVALKYVLTFDYGAGPFYRVSLDERMRIAFKTWLRPKGAGVKPVKLT
jgi:hypothetical protein